MEDCPVHCRLFTTIPGLSTHNLPVAYLSPTPSHNCQTLPGGRKTGVGMGGVITLIENHLSRWIPLIIEAIEHSRWIYKESGESLRPYFFPGNSLHGIYKKHLTFQRLAVCTQKSRLSPRDHNLRLRVTLGNRFWRSSSQSSFCLPTLSNPSDCQSMQKIRHTLWLPHAYQAIAHFSILWERVSALLETWLH